jgi:hypothetical protein
MKGIQPRLFLGTPLTSEVRMHLAESSGWKERHLLDAERLEEGRYEEETYLGSLLPHDSLSIEQLQKEEERVRDSLSRFCPQLDQGHLSFFLFPQIFLT